MIVNTVLIGLTFAFVSGFHPHSHVSVRLTRRLTTATMKSPNSQQQLRLQPSSRQLISGMAAAADSSDSDDAPVKNASIVTKIRNYFRGPNDGLTFRQRLGKMGLAVALSYGWVSNMSYTVTVSLAWYIHSKRTGLSPLAPGQWTKFLAVYAGFYIFNNIVRPIRLAMSVAISPKFDDVVLRIQNWLGVKKATAVTITVILANVVGTTVLMSLGIFIAATLAGVPIFVPKG